MLRRAVGVVVLLGVFAGTGIAAAKPGPPPPKPPKLTFSISGSVTGLYPGALRPLVVTLANATTKPMVVTRIDVAVSDASRRCRAANLSVPPFIGTVTLPARGTATVAMAATLLATAPNACQGATFGLKYTGTGTAS